MFVFLASVSVPVQGIFAHESSLKVCFNLHPLTFRHSTLRHLTLRHFTLHHMIVLNPLRDRFFRGNINIYLHFVSFLYIDIT